MGFRSVLALVLGAIVILTFTGIALADTPAESGQQTPVKVVSTDPNHPAPDKEKNQQELVPTISGLDETPEIDVEVVGEKEGEQPVPALAPTTGDVVTSINAAELESTGETNLADALEFLPGVTVTSQGRRFEKFVNVRATSTPVVLLDGALISNGIFANRILYTLPFSAIERVDVVRSSSNLLYGPQALMGGVINIVTKSGRGMLDGQAKLYAQGGSFNYRNLGIAAGQGDARQGLFAVYDHDDADSNLKFGGHNMERAFVKADYVLRNGDPFKLSVMTVDGSRRFDVWDKEWQTFAKTGPAYWGLDPYRERVEVLTYTHSLSANGVSGVDWVLWNRDQFYKNFSYGGPVKPKAGQTVFYDESGNIWGTSLLFRWLIGKTHYVRTGLETYKMDGYTQNYVLQKDGTLKQMPKVPYWTSASGTNNATGQMKSYVLQDEWAINPTTHFFYGGRYQVPGYGLKNTFTYATGLEKSLGSKMALYAHLGNGVVYPTPADLKANPTLKDQTSLNLDFGIQRRWHGATGRIGYFSADIKNNFVSYLKTGGDPAKAGDYVKVQADFVRSGWEAEVAGAMPRCRGLNYFFNYTYLHQEINNLPDVGDGQPLQLAVPPQGQFSTGLRWTSPNSRSRLALSYTHVDDQLARSGYYQYAYPLDGYQYANLTGAIDLSKGWAVNAALNNIFNEKYESQPGFPRPGRNFVLGISRVQTFE
jgi:outer membrane receptor protein involved in Fe transport